VDYGQNPSGLKWNKILSPHFQVIFPDELGGRAERLVNVLERVYEVENHSIKVKTQPITIILQNQPVESNAFVLLAPRRSEFNTLPPQNLEPIDWLNSLAVHEMRHVVQIDRVFNGKESTLFETIQIAIFGLVYPTWFFEGDAVDMESILTNGGRGRLPSWDIDLRANLLSNKNYSYSKYTLGSLKDNVPDYYRIGYFMVTKMRRDFGDSLFNKIYTGSLKVKPYPFSSSLKKQTGLNTHAFYQETVKDLKKQWEDSLSKGPLRFYTRINFRKDSLAMNFYLPKNYPDNKLIYLKEGLNILPGIYTLDTLKKKEERILYIGNQTNPNFDYKNGYLTWDETRNDPRFQYRDYSNLFLYDIRHHKKYQLTHKAKLFSPVLNPKADKIAAVRVYTKYSFALSILDLRNKGKIQDLPNPHHYFFETPSFDSSGKKILAVAVNSWGKALYEYDMDWGKETLLKPFSYTEMNRPVYSNGSKIYYQSAKTGRDQIFSFDTKTHSENVITATKFGAFSPQISGNSILFEDFTSLGRDIARAPINPSLTIQDTQSHSLNFFLPLVNREPGGNPLFRSKLNHLAEDSLNGKDLDSLFKPIPISRFHEAAHLFYFHSLLPDIQNFNLNQNTFLTGLKLSSTNLLNTTQTYLGIYYQNGVNAAEYQAGITYKKYYPEIILSFTDKKRNATAIEELKTGNVFLPYSYRSRLVNLGIGIPLNFISTLNSYSSNFEISTSFQNNYALTIPLSRFQNFITYIKFPLHYSFLFEKNEVTTARDIYSRWGQNISLDFEHLPFSNNLKGHYFAMNTGFYFPGIFNHHVIRLGFNYQYNVGVYQGQRSIDEINGFSYLPANALQNTLLVNYYLPFSYPDWEIGRWAYIKKISGGLFYDYENLLTHSSSFPGFYTYGPQVRVDLNLLRYYLPVFQFGAKLILFQNSSISSPKIEFVFNYTL